MVSLYYQDTVHICKACQNNFVFSASEKQFWYEKINIYTDISPKMCVTCRKEARFKRQLTIQLQGLLMQVIKAPSKAVAIEISRLYLELGNKAKAGIYIQKSKNYKD
jgi:hypothetical protein